MYFTHFLTKNFEISLVLWAQTAEKNFGVLAHNLHRTREMGGGKIITGATGRGPPTMV